MKKTFRRIMCVVLALMMAFPTFNLTAVKASAATAQKTYTISSGNTRVYSDTRLTKGYGWIYGSDEVTILDIYGQYCRVRYYISGGRTKEGYVRTSTLLTATNGYNYSARAKITTYKRPGGATYGCIAKNDRVLALGTSGSYTQVRYPVSFGYKFAFIRTSDYNNYVKPQQLIKNGWYMIVSGNSSQRVLDINSSSKSNGGNLEIYNRNNTSNQRFYLQYLSNGFYSIKALHSGKYIHVADGNNKTANVHQWDGYNHVNAQWLLTSAGNGYYYLRNKGNGSYLDNSGGRTTPGNNVTSYPYNGGANQKWAFVATSSQTSSPKPAPTYSTYYVTTQPGNNLLLRSGPGSGYSVKSRIPSGSAIQVASISVGWARAKYNGTEGYCSASYISKTKPVEHVESLVRSRLDKIANGSLRYNNNTTLAVGYKFTGSRSNEQCKGYAKNVFYLCFGITPGSTNSKPNNHTLSSTSGMKLVGSVTNRDPGSLSALFKKARPGDFVQIRRTHTGSHSAIVYSVSSIGVTFLEANLDGANTVYKKTYTWRNLCDKNEKMSVYTATSYKLK